MNTFRLVLPASSANVGPCFDSAGIALNRYLTLQVKGAKQWEFEHLSSFLPSNTNYEDHFIYQIANQTAERYNKTLPPCSITIDSDIPLARGLGSSASAVVAGIELANQLCNLALTAKDKLQVGTEIEGHPDNVAPVIFGGFVVAVETGKNDIEHVHLPPLDLDLVVYIPSIELKTEEARKALPDQFSQRDAIKASSISNLMLTALLSGDYTLAGEMMEQDLFHEPHRANLIPYYHEIRQKAKQYGAYGTVISGAGPTMISFVPSGKGITIAELMQSVFPDYQVESLQIDNQGIQVTYESASIKKAVDQ